MMQDDNRKKYLIIGGIAFAVLMLALLLVRSVVSFGTIDVTAPSSTPNKAEVSVEVTGQSEGSETQSFKLKPGETHSLRVHTGNYRVKAGAGNIKSVDIVTVTSSSTTKVTAPSGEQRAIKQRGANANCPIIIGGKLFSYACGGAEGAVVQHGNSLGVGNNYLYNALTFINLQPTKDGFLGYYADTKPEELQYLQPQTESIQPVTLPANIQTLMKKEQGAVVTQKTADSTRFLLIFNGEGKIFLFQGPGDTSPQELKLDHNLKLNDAQRKFSVLFEGDRVVVYAGIAVEAGEGSPGDKNVRDNPNNLPTYEVEYDTTGKLVQSVRLPKETVGDNFHRLRNNYYALEHAYGVDFLYYDGKKFKTTYTLADVGGWAIQNDTMFVQSEGTLYQFIPGDKGTFGLHSRFTSGEFAVSALYDSPQGLLFTAFAGSNKNGDAPLNVYQLLDTKQVGDQPAVHKHPTLKNLYSLMDYGITEDQMNSLEAAFGYYADTHGIFLTGAAASNIEPVWRDPESTVTVDVINFTANINDVKFFKAKIEYSDLKSIRLYLYNRDTGALEFDSAAVE